MGNVMNFCLEDNIWFVMVVAVVTVGGSVFQILTHTKLSTTAREGREKGRRVSCGSN